MGHQSVLITALGPMVQSMGYEIEFCIDAALHWVFSNSDLQSTCMENRRWMKTASKPNILCLSRSRWWSILRSPTWQQEGAIGAKMLKVFGNHKPHLQKKLPTAMFFKVKVDRVATYGPHNFYMILRDAASPMYYLNEGEIFFWKVDSRRPCSGIITP